MLVDIDGEAITKSDIDLEYTLLTSGLENSENLTFIPDQFDHQTQNLRQLRDKILDSLIEQKLLYKFIEKDRNFMIDPETMSSSCKEKTVKLPPEIEGFAKKQVMESEQMGADLQIKRLARRLCQRKITQRYIERVVYRSISVSSKEAQLYLQKHPEKLLYPTQVEVSQIVLPNEHSARKIRVKVTRRNFADMAKKHSITPESINGGNLKPFSAGEMPRFFNAAFSMKVGQISDIIKSAYGFHILLLKRKLPKGRLSVKEAIPIIQKSLRRTKKEREYKKWVDMALHNVNIKAPYIRR